MSLPPPSSNPTPMEDSDPTPMEQSDVTSTAEGAEAVEAKTGVKRALSMSPQAGGESQDAGVVSGDTQRSNGEMLLCTVKTRRHQKRPD